MLPIDKLRSLDLQLDLGLGQLVIDKLPIDNAILKAQGKGGQLALQDLRGDLYNGNFNAKGSLDVRQAVPQLSIQNRISGVPVKKLIESQGEKSPLTGRLELTTDLRTSGNSQKAWIDALNGTSSEAEAQSGRAGHAPDVLYPRWRGRPRPVDHHGRDRLVPRCEVRELFLAPH